MILKTLQWNIGGGKARKAGDDPNDALAYSNEALDSDIEIIRRYNPDIITLQESHSDDKGNQAQTMAENLGLKFFANNVYDKSHIEEGKGLSQAIISRFPIKENSFTFFYNPKLETTGPKGEHWVSHDKGVTDCIVDLGGGITLNVKTSHSFPYRRFHVEPFDERLLPLRNDMAEKLMPKTDRYIYQGDLNYNEFSVAELLPKLMTNGVQEVILTEPTTPKGRKYDHVLYRGIKHIKSIVISNVLTDHFPIYSEFEIQG